MGWARIKVRPTCRIRWGTPADHLDMAGIEGASFDRPWGLEKLRHRLNLPYTSAMVAEGAYGQLLGFAVYTLELRWIALESIAVHPGYRRESIGRQIVANLGGKTTDRRPILRAVVRESLLPGHLFLAACGLRAVEVIRGHFQDTGEDGYVFTGRKEVAS